LRVEIVKITVIPVMAVTLVLLIRHFGRAKKFDLYTACNM